MDVLEKRIEVLEGKEKNIRLILNLFLAFIIIITGEITEYNWLINAGAILFILFSALGIISVFKKRKNGNQGQARE